MKDVVTVLGKDKKGIIAEVSTALYKMEINIEDISQTIMQDYFTMIMLVDTSDSKLSFKEIFDSLKKLGENLGLTIRIQQEDIFSAMHSV